MCTIRPAQLVDLPAITEIYNEAILTTTATFDTEPKALDEQRTWFEQHGPSHPSASLKKFCTRMCDRVFLARRRADSRRGGLRNPLRSESAQQRSQKGYGVYFRAEFMQRGTSMIIELGGAVAGWASLSPWSDRCAYSDTAELSIYIKEEYRGRGLGRMLLEAILPEGQRLGVHTVIARIADANPASIRLHESMGFEHIGVMKKVGYKFGRRLDVYLMQKTLAEI